MFFRRFLRCALSWEGFVVKADLARQTVFGIFVPLTSIAVEKTRCSANPDELHGKCFAFQVCLAVKFQIKRQTTTSLEIWSVLTVGHRNRVRDSFIIDKQVMERLHWKWFEVDRPCTREKLQLQNFVRSSRSGRVLCGVQKSFFGYKRPK